MSDVFNPEAKDSEYKAINDKAKFVLDFFSLDKVKNSDNGQSYLPIPTAFIGKTKEKELYAEYLEGAFFPENILNDQLSEMIGLAFKKGMKSTLPGKISNMEHHADNTGNNLVSVLREIVKEMLLSKRCAIVSDYDEDENEPFVSLYGSNSIYKTKFENNNLTFISLSEDSGEVDENGKQLEQIRIFKLDEEGFCVVETWAKDSDKAWQHEEDDDVYPEIKGKKLKYIPVRIAEVEHLPLHGAALLIKKGYQESANYYSITKKLGIPKMVIKSETKAEDFKSVSMDANSALKLGVQDDAKYIQVSVDGVEPCKTAMQDKFDEAIEAGVRFQEKNSAETGEALKTRSATKEVKLSDLVQVAITELTEATRVCAQFVSVDPDKVKLSMEVELVEKPLDAATVGMYERGTQAGRISNEDYWRYLHNNGHIVVPMKDNKLDFAEYKKQIENGQPEA